MSALERRSDERDPAAAAAVVAEAEVDSSIADGFDTSSPDATLFVLLLAFANDDAVRLIVGRFNLLLLAGCDVVLLVDGFFLSS